MIRGLALLLVGFVLGVLVPSAHADTVSEIVQIRRALESIAHSLERCSK